MAEGQLSEHPARKKKRSTLEETCDVADHYLKSPLLIYAVLHLFNEVAQYKGQSISTCQMRYYQLCVPVSTPRLRLVT